MTLPPTRPAPPLSRLAWLGIALLALAYAYVYYQRTLNGPFRFADDVAQHYLWLFGEHHGAPWRDGFYARTSAAIQPWGYYALLKFLALFLDPLTISRYGVFGIALLTVGYATALFRRYVPTVLAVAGGCVLFHYSLDICAGTLSRGFMIPLLLAGGYYLLRGHARGTAATLVIAALVYPPALIVHLTVLGLYKVGELGLWWRGRGCRGGGVPTDDPSPTPPHPLRQWPWYVGGAALSLLLIWLHARGVKAHPDLGNFLPRATLLTAPEFSGSGRVAVTNSVKTEVTFFIDYFSNRYLPSAFPPYFARGLLAAALGLGLLHYRKLGALTGWAVALAAATVLLFVFGQAVFPLLFLPDRFIVYPWRLLAVLVLLLNAAGLYHLRPRPWLATLLVVLLLGYAHYNRAPAGFGFVGLDDADKTAFYAAVRDLPPTATVAAPPIVASWLPVMTPVMPFISHETAHLLYFERYHDHVMPRFADYAAAVSTPGPDLTPVVAFLDKWSIDYLIVDRRLLRKGQHDLWSPHKQVYEANRASSDGTPSALLQVPDSVGRLVPPHYHFLSRADLRTLVAGE